MLSPMGVPSVRCVRHWPAAIAVSFFLLAACGSGSAPKRADPEPRPSTNATLQILEPEPNAATGRDVVVRFQLNEASLDPPGRLGGALRPDRGHLHLSVDGALVAMPYGLAQRVPDLTSGEHTIEAEFVASDHVSFANRVVAAVSFTVK